MVKIEADSGSFRDPSGQVFHSGGHVFRTVNESIADDFEFAEASGLFTDLIARGWLIGYQKVAKGVLGPQGAAAVHVLEHPRLPMISYPYEWPFSALKAASLLHLDIHLAALEKNVTLSDSTAYNVQYLGARPIFIDLLSFVRYREGDIWAGHKQFCEQFLNPLLLHANFGVAHNTWYRGALEGISAGDLAALLPWWQKCRPKTFMHVVLQSRFQRRAAKPARRKPGAAAKTVQLPKTALCHMLKSMRNWIASLEPKGKGETLWQNYATTTSYNEEETALKKKFIAEFVKETGVKQVWDLGCNAGDYLAAALDAGAEYGVGFDFDLGALEAAFARASQEDLPIQCLFLDAANPSPDQGWAQKERMGLQKRAKGDAVLALAFVHHLAITKNIPLDRLVDWLVGLAPKGVIEFVPKQDPMVQELLRHRVDIFPDYTEEAFRDCLQNRARIYRVQKVSSSGRCLFWFEREPADVAHELRPR